MPFQPPTRPHSANPQMSFNPTSIFPRGAGLSGASGSSSSSTSVYKQNPGKSGSMSSFGRQSRDAEDWEDAWDSSSDKEDSTIPAHGYSRLQQSSVKVNSGPVQDSRTAPMPVQTKNRSSGPKIGGIDEDQRHTEPDKPVVSSSWASTSYHHVSPPLPTRPALVPAKTYSEGTVPPPPGTVLPESPSKARGERANGSKLPPGGAWEIVEPAELREEEIAPPAKVGKEAVREDVEDILKDPLQLLSSLSLDGPATPVSTNPSSSFPFLTPTSSYPETPSTSQSYASPSPEASTSSTSFPLSLSANVTPKAIGRKEGLGRQRSVRTERRREKFAKVLRGRENDIGGGVDVAELRKLAWSGIPSEMRPIAWQLLLNYLPLPSQPRLTTLNRKRKEYTQLVDQYFGRGLGSLDQQIWHQIEIDVPRTRPGVPLWSCIQTQRSLERILYVWAIRHPASGYVQGINDLVTPFFQVFLSAYIDTDPEVFDLAYLEPHVLSAIEADTFWCLTKLLDGIQDNYISQQPGIQRLVKRMSELVKRIDTPLAAHFEDQGVEFMQFAFRWMNCLLMREISVKCTIRMWDTYLAEGTDAFSQFHLYVCSALLVKYSDRLREMDFQEMIMFLQCLPTQSWTDHDIELLLSEAYVLKNVWQGAENHFANLPHGSQGQFGMLGR
ncbi:tbc1 domain family protein [Kwoniella heveanensis BCC8398]|uniref:Tbc1 domain family protein n=1 Tax=Kwoniella heveanensis BCC8398 TaxID=1296120 RepID=A0A1B9GJT0_9TREE|nr:tbc1 domain family protein [Kwoniella heveanensis BCC8398]